MQDPTLDAALSALAENQSHHLNLLEQMVRIASISFPGFDPEKVRESALHGAGILRDHGFDDVCLLEVEGAHPAIYGEKICDPKLPTVLLYAHHDVQPPGDPSLWRTEPFSPTHQEGRLYGRGAADDKAGFIAHVAAVHSYLSSVGTLPINVKIIVEGEEECGSTNLSTFLERYAPRLRADALILTDTANIDTGIPSLTTSLRGLLAFDIEVQALKTSLHSGLWGGALPCPAIALSKVLASLVDARGRIVLEGLKAPEIAQSRPGRWPIDAKTFQKQAGLMPGAEGWGDAHPLDHTFADFAVSVHAMQSSSREQARNIINDKAWARVGIRIPSPFSADEVKDAVELTLSKRMPWSLPYTLSHIDQADPWSTAGEHPAFKAAEEALEAGYGTRAYRIGCGGSIPFVEPMVRAFSDIPALMIGIEDPLTQAHGENESLCIPDFWAACRSLIHLFPRLAAILSTEQSSGSSRA